MTQVPHLTDYEAAEQWLISLTDYERLLGNAPVRYNTRTFDRDHFRQQMERLGTPQGNYAVIHVAGTKGKGSTCALMEAALRRCGLKTGLYTSPHLYRFTERIRVNGKEIAENDFCRLVERMGREMMEDSGEAPGETSFRTVFEILTAGALVWFAEQQVDIAIIETGLGGRLDSTNVFHGPRPLPLINVITAIGLDHTAILGESISAIAGEKAGIIQPHGRTVVAQQADVETEAMVHAVVETRCREIGAQQAVFVREALVTDSTRENANASPDCRIFRFREARPNGAALEAALATGLEVCPGLAGEHQVSNTSTALRALMELERAKLESTRPLEASRIAEGMADVHWPGRFQQVQMADTDVVIDGAHCAMSARALALACQARFGDRSAVAVMGFLKDKAGAEMLQAFAGNIPLAAAISVCPPSVRSMSANDIAETMRIALAQSHSNNPPPVHSAADMAEGLRMALELATSRNGYVVVFGSLYLVGPALDAARSLSSGHPL